MHADLIARLEQATGPDRELDAAIAVAVTPGMFAEGGFVGFTGKGDMEPPPAFTASIDAALTLVPEGWAVRNLHQWVADNWLWSCDLQNKEFLDIIKSAESATTPALAICIAALRAQARHD